MLTLFISSVIAFIFDISLATFLLVNNNKKTTNTKYLKLKKDFIRL
mgnify:CR=1 FL=1